MCMCVWVCVCVCSFCVLFASTHIIDILGIYSCSIHVISSTWISHIICIYSWSIHVYLLNMNKLIKRNPPRGGFLFTMLPDHEPCVDPPRRTWYKSFEGGSFFLTFFQNLQIFFDFFPLFSLFCFNFFPDLYFQCSIYVIGCHFCCPIPAQTRLSLRRGVSFDHSDIRSM